MSNVLCCAVQTVFTFLPDVRQGSDGKLLNTSKSIATDGIIVLHVRSIEAVEMLVKICTCI